MKRRRFIQKAAGAGLAIGTGLPSLCADLSAFADTSNLSRIEARYYQKLPDREIECQLCPRVCRLGDKERGYCGVRENQGGTYYTLVYGKACSLNIDPIEKKPFFHFLPGTNALSLATAGCNVNCKFCQNWEISQVRPEQVYHFDLPPEAGAQEAANRRCPTIAYTYTEPVVFYEYMYDMSRAARGRGIRNAVVTAGHIQPKPLEDLIKVVDAIKVDLKGFTQAFYKNYVRGELETVLEAIELIARSNVWLEIVYLVIPTLNDNPDDIRRMSRWVVNRAGPGIPLHFSRFHPQYLIKNLPPTPISTLEKSREIALAEGIRYAYVGNVPGHPAENTVCPKCGKTLIERRGYAVRSKAIKGGKCRFCEAPIPGVWT